MNEPIKVLTAILERGMGEEAASVLRGLGYPLHFVLRGRGTARSDVLHYLGLGETEKDVLISLLPTPALGPALDRIRTAFQLDRHGRGIAFSTRLTAISAMAAKVAQRADAAEQEAEAMNKEPHALVLVLVDHGGADAVMEVAWSAGAGGGTILHARQLGLDALEGADAAGLVAEKETVAILVPAALRDKVMEAVNREAGMHTQHHGILLSLPVDAVAGL